MSNFLIVDLDRSLVKTDIFRERLARGLLRNPFLIIFIFFKYSFKLEKIKIYLEKYIDVPVASLPFNHEVVKIANEYISNGRKVILATACDIKTATKISDHLGIFTSVLGTTSEINLKGKKKLEAILQIVKGEKFDYIGDSYSDVPIWESADRKYFVSGNVIFNNKITSLINDPIRLNNKKGNFWVSFINQIRVHQWSKNLLLFFPLLFSVNDFFFDKALELVLFFLLFCIVTSSTYVINDVLDLDSDRVHSQKKNRPLASGEFDPLTWLICSTSVLLSCVIISGLVFGYTWSILLSIYGLLSISYSTFLKTVSILDLFLLSIFYVYRIISGIIVWESSISIWTLGFTFFFFFSLGCLKRWTEVSSLAAKENIVTKAGGYSLEDGKLLFICGLTSAFISNTIFLLYGVNRFDLDTLTSCLVFFLMSLLLLFFLIKIWSKGARGEVGHDPVTYVLQTRWTQLWSILFIFGLVILGNLQ